MKKKKKKNCRPKSSKKLQKLVIHIFTLIFMYIFTKFQRPNWIRTRGLAWLTRGKKHKRKKKKKKKALGKKRERRRERRVRREREEREEREERA